MTKLKDDADYLNKRIKYPYVYHAFRCQFCGLVMFEIPRFGICEREDCIGDIDNTTIILKKVSEIRDEIVYT